MATTASFVIDFGSIESAILKVELDDVKNGDKTTFVKGDTVHFRVSADVNYEFEVTSGSITHSATTTTLPSGVVTNDGGVDELIEDEVLSFIKGTAPSVTKYIAPTIPIENAIVNQTWYGNNLGAIAPTSGGSVQAANVDVDSLGIASIDYTTRYNEHQLVPPAGMTDIYHIIVYIKAVA